MKAPLVLAVVSAALIIAQQVCAKAVRDALFLSTFNAEVLPKAMIASAALSLPAVLVMTVAMARFGPGRVIPGLLLANAALHAGEWFLLERFPQTVGMLVYLHISVLGAIAISGFWSVVSERFDPYSARRAVGYISGGSTIGGLAGGLFTNLFATRIEAKGMLLVLVALASLAAIGISRLSTKSTATRANVVTASDFKSVIGSTYLRQLAILVSVTGIGAAVLDYSFKASASSAFPSGVELLSFFAAFYTGVSVLTVLLQFTLARRSLDQLGLGPTLAVLPGTLIAAGVLVVFIPEFWAVLLLRGAEATLQNSFFRSAYEPLYTPLPARQKRAAKTIIDVAFDRLGEGLGSAWILLLLWFVTSGKILPFAIGTAVVLAFVSVWLSTRLQRGYVAELASSLRDGKLQIDARHISDVTTRLTVSQTQMDLDRGALLRQIAELRERSHGAPELPNRALDLLSDDKLRIQSALAQGALDPRLVSFVIPLLARDDVSANAIRALRSVAVKSVGQLVDALLDQEQPASVRRRVPRVLRMCPNRRAMRGLTDGLADPEFEVRFRCGLSLLALYEQDRSLRPPARVLFEAIKSEVEVNAVVWTSRRLTDTNLDDEFDPDAAKLIDLADRSLSHVFTLLSLALDRDAVQLALRALTNSDEKLRGTALEYLENVIPADVRVGLWPHLKDTRSETRPRKREQEQIMEELKRSIAGS